MHVDALAFIARQAATYGPFRTVVELGSRDVNGSPRSLFPGADYTGVDLMAGPGVDVVADAVEWRPAVPVDVVVCAEVLEHAPDPAGIIDTAWDALRPAGRLILTAACDPRAPHSAVDGGPVRAGEWYGNVAEDELAGWLAGWKDVEIETYDRGDIYALAVKS